jgi:hypothetical protein
MFRKSGNRAILCAKAGTDRGEDCLGYYFLFYRGTKIALTRRILRESSKIGNKDEIGKSRRRDGKVIKTVKSQSKEKKGA